MTAVALLIELGFDVNARSRTAPLHEAAMRGNLPVIRLLLDHGADPNIHDTGYDATPAGWAEHHGQHEAQQLLEALEHPDPATPSTEEPCRPDHAAGSGDANRDGRVHGRVGGTVRRARIDAGRGDRLAGPPRRGRPDPPLPWTRRRRSNGCGSACSPTARCRSARSSKQGDRVLAHVHRVGDDELGPPERFLVAEVHDGQITHLRGYATEPEAHDALHAGAPPDAPISSRL